MFQIILNVYRFLFARKSLFRLNRLLFQLSLRGMGILNYENNKLSGKDHFLKSYLKNTGDLPTVVFDVGANIGEYSSIVASRKQKDGKIY